MHSLLIKDNVESIILLKDEKEEFPELISNIRININNNINKPTLKWDHVRLCNPPVMMVSLTDRDSERSISLLFEASALFRKSKCEKFGCVGDVLAMC